ncbi:MAG: hypothetical protein WCF04_04255, partial [Candidatus Nanopelagicales bacterium]
MAMTSQIASTANPATSRTASPGTASQAALLDLLDRGETLSMPERALLLARAADRDADAGALPLGGRDRLILRLHEALFGPMIEARDTCPHCREPASFEVSCATLAEAGASRGDDPADVIDVRVGEYAVLCRPPRGVDLIEATRTTDGSAA